MTYLLFEPLWSWAPPVSPAAWSVSPKDALVMPLSLLPQSFGYRCSWLFLGFLLTRVLGFEPRALCLYYTAQPSPQPKFGDSNYFLLENRSCESWRNRGPYPSWVSLVWGLCCATFASDWMHFPHMPYSLDGESSPWMRHAHWEGLIFSVLRKAYGITGQV